MKASTIEATFGNASVSWQLALHIRVQMRMRLPSQVTCLGLHGHKRRPRTRAAERNGLQRSRGPRQGGCGESADDATRVWPRCPKRCRCNATRCGGEAEAGQYVACLAAVHVFLTLRILVKFCCVMGIHDVSNCRLHCRWHVAQEASEEPGSWQSWWRAWWRKRLPLQRYGASCGKAMIRPGSLVENMGEGTC